MHIVAEISSQIITQRQQKLSHMEGGNSTICEPFLHVCLEKTKKHVCVFRFHNEIYGCHGSLISMSKLSRRKELHRQAIHLKTQRMASRKINKNIFFLIRSWTVKNKNEDIYDVHRKALINLIYREVSITLSDRIINQ